MIPVTVSGTNCLLLPYQPGDASGLKLSVSIPVGTERGFTGATSRRPQAVAPRFSFEYRAVLLASEYQALRAVSLVSQDEPILVPLWPHAWRPGIDAQTISAGLIVAYTADFAAYAINPGSYSGYTYAAPLIYGRFRQPPRMASVADGLVTAEIAIDEDSPVAYALGSMGLLASDTNFTNAAGYSAPVFPFVADWSHAPEPAFAVTDVERSTVGPGRQRATAFYPQLPEQVQSATFTQIGASDAAKLVEWWIRRCGEADAHWVPSAQSPWHLVSAASAGATSISISLGSPAPAIGSILALNGAQTEIVRVTGVSGSALTLAAALANSWAVADTRVTPAFLARHTDRALQIDYSPAGWLASCEMSWRQVAAEEGTLPSGETRGTTIGRLPGAAWFFKVDLDYNGATSTTYLTNFESGASGATVGSHTWVYNACDFDRLLQSVDLEDDSCTFKMRWYAGCPLANWLPGGLAARGYLTIYRADVSSSGVFSNYAAVWKGELSQPTIEGANISMRVLGANAIFARRGPRQLMSTICGTNLFKPRCGLALSDWLWNATITAVSGNIVTIGSLARANGSGNPAGFGAADWFALGWMGWTSGGLPLREGILTSTVLTSGHITLTLDRTCSLAVSSSVQVAPGCDRQGSTCRNTFNNYSNFRGFEYIPAISPNFVIPQNTGTGAKK